MVRPDAAQDILPCRMRGVEIGDEVSITGGLFVQQVVARLHQVMLGIHPRDAFHIREFFVEEQALLSREMRAHQRGVYQATR